MNYRYEDHKAEIFSDEGQKMFLAIRDEANRLLSIAGCFRAEEAMRAARCGSSWTMLACLDRMVELGEIRRVTKPGETWGQHQIFVSAKGSA